MHVFSFKTVNCFKYRHGEHLTYPMKAIYVGKGLSGLVERRLRMRHLCSVSPETFAEPWPARAGVQWADWGALWALTGQLACGTMFSSGSAIQARRALRKITKKWKHEERWGWGAEVAVVPHGAIVRTRCSPVPRLEELSSHREAKSELSFIRNLWDV